VARGDLNRKIHGGRPRRILELKNKHQHHGRPGSLVCRGESIAGSARVGTEGKLGGKGVVARRRRANWKDITTTSIHGLNVTDQVRGIVKVVTAVANGDRNSRLAVQGRAKSRLGRQQSTIDHYPATFADQVTNVAREVGVEGRPGGQANVRRCRPWRGPDWKPSTCLLAKLTSQVRAIAEVAKRGTRVTSAFPSRSRKGGEVAV